MNTFQLANFEDFKNVTRSYNININDNQLALFKKYYEVLIEWNKKINLISRCGSQPVPTGENDPIIEKHFLDSILFLPEIERFPQFSILNSQFFNFVDIGSGAGFPAIPLAIMKAEWKFTLAESTRKKADFLKVLVQELDLRNIRIINDRVEVISKENKYKNNFDFVTVRAVAKLDELLKYSLPLLNKNGCLLAYKAKDIDEEVKQTEKLIEKHNLNLEIFSKECNDIIRKLVVIQRA